MEIGKNDPSGIFGETSSLRYKKESDMGIRHIYACLLGCVFVETTEISILGGGFKDFDFYPDPWGNDPI